MSRNSKTAEQTNSCVTQIASKRSDGAGESPDVSQEDTLSQDLGSIDLFDEFGDWKDDYANAVGIPRWSEL